MIDAITILFQINEDEDAQKLATSFEKWSNVLSDYGDFLSIDKILDQNAAEVNVEFLKRILKDLPKHGAETLMPMNSLLLKSKKAMRSNPQSHFSEFEQQSDKIVSLVYKMNAFIHTIEALLKKETEALKKEREIAQLRMLSGKQDSKKEMEPKSYAISFRDKLKDDLLKLANDRAGYVKYSGKGKPDFKNKFLVIALFKFWREKRHQEIFEDDRKKYSIMNDSVLVNGKKPKIANYTVTKQFLESADGWRDYVEQILE